eukprot:COSAG02_NODE_2589_length_8471_cov_113.759556_7_plen_39_part_00
MVYSDGLPSEVRVLTSSLRFLRMYLLVVSLLLHCFAAT